MYGCDFFARLCNALADLEGGGLRGLQPLPPFQISKIKESNKTKQKKRKEKKKTILLKRKKRERVTCLSSFYVCTCRYSVSINIFLLNPPLKMFWIRACNVKYLSCNFTLHLYIRIFFAGQSNMQDTNQSCFI